MTKFLYQQLQQQLRDEIKSGQRIAGEQLPSIRQLCKLKNLSKATVLCAYSNLEAEGLIEARARSGYFVSPSTDSSLQTLKTPGLPPSSTAPTYIATDQVLIDIMTQGAAFDLLPAQPDSLVNEHLRRCLARAHRQQSGFEQHYYDQPQGLAELRDKIAQRLRQGGGPVDKQDLVLTSGCQHALLLALMATTQAGDIVAIESPSFYGALQLLETLGLQALEVPSSANSGLCLDALASVLQQWDIKALLIYPCYSTPTGSVMPDENKRQLLKLTQATDIAIIEDDIYAELHFGLQRPRSVYSYDDSGSVLLCSSLSKCLSRDLRIGWIAPGKYMERVKRLKVITSLASSQSVQRGVYQFLQEGGLDKHLRQTRRQYQQQGLQLQQLIMQHIPGVVSCSRPQGGLTLWLELETSVDTLKLYNIAKEQGIVITPGGLFSHSQDKYSQFLRMSFLQPWTEARISALQKLGQLIKTHF